MDSMVHLAGERRARHRSRSKSRMGDGRHRSAGNQNPLDGIAGRLCRSLDELNIVHFMFQFNSLF
jgi:hypothetical protein